MTVKPSLRPRTSTYTVSPSTTRASSSASPTPCLRVGEKVPEVISPTSRRRRRAPACAGAGCRGRRRRCRAASPAGLASRSARSAVVAPEAFLVPADRPAEPGLDGCDRQRDVLAVQRVAHLGAQGVAGAEAGGHDAVLAAPAAISASHTETAAAFGIDQLVAALAGVAGPADDDRRPRRGRPRRTTCSRARSGTRQPSAPRRSPAPARRGSRSRDAGSPRRCRRARPRRAAGRPRSCWRRSGSGRPRRRTRR